jgi:2-polyprenyl-3-methyl-5-hydroxy-6-metoxy-1,4-benzoquinol methylase
LVKQSNLPSALNTEAFRITDAHYGTTAAIFQCQDCDFVQCSDLEGVLDYYVYMDDQGYEQTRQERALQARKLLQVATRHRPSGRLLDVGAGSGILVEEALKLGFAAEGIEPARSLQQEASRRGLPVRSGVLPQAEVAGPYDVVTLIDVIEHVPDPLGLLTQIRDLMTPESICVLVTPDVGSIAARLMGWRWWHYRVAHIGYFSRNTLQKALRAVALTAIETSRPTWYFPASYLASRVMGYLPPSLRLSVPKTLNRLTVPLNLFDSLLVICKRQ